MFALFVAASWASTYYIDWLWFRNLGYLEVFWRTLASRWAVGLAGGAFFGSILFFNLWIATRDLQFLPPNVVPFPYQRWFRPRGLTALLAAGSAVFGAMAGVAVSQEWLSFLLYRNRVAFGVTDPLFGHDVSYYVFALPVFILLQQTLNAALLLAILAAGGIYALTDRIHLDVRWINVHPRALTHLSVLLGSFLLLKGVGYWLAAYRLLFSPRGAAFGASYTDIYAQLPALKAMTVLAVLVALLAFATPRLRNYRVLLGGLGALLAVSFVLGTVVPSLVQNFVVRPNEIAKETPFIKLNIQNTRRAYNLDRIQEQPFPVAEGLTRADLDAAGGTIGNIRLWDWRVLQSAYKQLQGIRPYYSFNDVDVDRYRVGGQLRQTVLSAREISYRDLPGKTWINQHLKYTHGYGAVASPASEVTAEGQPPLWVKDIPPVAAAPMAAPLRIDRPEIYFGEQTAAYAIVNTLEEEFNYPQGDQNAYTTYAGRGGIPIGGLLPRIAFALRTGDYNVLFSRALTRESRALIFRSLPERVQRIAPFLMYDRDPYLVVSGGRLYWIQDAYTVTGAYPYSEPTLLGNVRVNYIRNAVKVVVDAYHGDVTFYVADAADPLIRAFQKVFPRLFRPLQAMDPDLRAHLRYPEDLFRVQAEQYRKYHMQDPVVFYNKEDMWGWPQEKVGNEVRLVDPYYVIMELPGAGRPEFLLMMPYTPNGRQNMIAWLAARTDGERYGDLLVYKFPKQKVVYGPEQVEALIDQNDAIAEKLNLWNQQGSQVQRGNLLVIPVRESLLYVEPIYLQSANTKLPELRRVIVAYGNRVVMADTLDQALAAVFGPGGGGTGAGPGGTQTAPAPAPGDTGSGGPGEARALAREANRLFLEAQDALRRGDWAGYGERIRQLGEVLNRLERQ